MEQRIGRIAVDGARWRAFKRGLQTVHLWLGLILGIPIIVIGLSGSALLLQREILSYSIPAATASGPQASLTRMIAAAHAGAPATVQFDFANRPPRSVVYVDPVSLAVLGTDQVVARGPILGFLINTHAFLGMPSTTGLRIVGWMAVAMTFMALSGLVLWWPRKGSWGSAFWIKRGASGLRLHVELHHVVGFWGSAVFLAMGISGIYLVFPETFRHGVEAVLPAGLGSGEAPLNHQPGAAPLDADGAVTAALAVL